MLVQDKETLAGKASRATRDALQDATDAVEDTQEALTTLRVAKAGIDTHALKSRPKAFRRAMEKQAAELTKWHAATGSAALFKGIESALESFIEGKRITKDGETRFETGKGSVRTGSGFFDKDGNKLTESDFSTIGTFRKGEITVDNLNTTWNMLKATYRTRNVPDSVLAGAIEGLFGRHDEWPESVKIAFMRQHKDAFMAQLTTTPASGDNTGTTPEDRNNFV